MDSKSVIDKFKQELCVDKKTKGSIFKLSNEIVDDILNGKILDSKTICDGDIDYLYSIIEHFQTCFKKTDLDKKQIRECINNINTPITNVISCYISINNNNEVFNYNFLVNADINKDNCLCNCIIENDMLNDTSIYELIQGMSALFTKINKLENDNKKLWQENESLKNQVFYQPGGQGMLDAKANFEKLANKK